MTAVPDRRSPVVREEGTAREEGSSSGGDGVSWKPYARFGLMILTSTILMFLLNYTNTFAWDHVRWSEERVYMALLMGAMMAVVMMAFMWNMHAMPMVNVAIVVVAVALGALALWLSRSQHFVDDREYMKGMIPHHSIAILTSDRADIDDVRVRELACGIERAQRREIQEMDWLVDDIAENGEVTTQEEADRRPVPEFEGTC